MKSFNIKEVLDNLGIIPDDMQVVSDAGEGYFILLTSNLTEDDKHKLTNIGFEAVNEELWFKPGDVSEEISIDQLFSILERKKERDFLNNKTEIIKIISILWDRIVDNFKCTCELLGQQFQPTSRQVFIACKFKDYICTNEDDFKIFISYLRQFSYESFRGIKNEETGKKLIEALYNHVFYKKLRLRHYFDHDLGLDKDSEIKHDEMRDYYVSLLGKPIARKPLDFFNMQKKLLELCEDWFEEIIKYCESNYR